ncbi:MAG: FtsX-like permease family protein, partial [Asgard group archaeon]|nr:FtsX-like permease family protein [Asgard group archaeon]
GIEQNLGVETGTDITMFDFSYDVNGTELLEEIAGDYNDITASSYSTLPISSALSGIWSASGDEIFFESFYTDVLGVPENILDPLYQESIIYTEGDGTMFENVQENLTVIISDALSKELNLGVGDTLRLKLLTLNPILISLGYTKDVFLEIVGVIGKLPGFSGIHQQERFASGSTILIGEDTWQALTNLDFQESAFRLFFKTTSTETSLTVGEELRRKYQNDNIYVWITQENIDRINEANETRVVLVNVMLIFTIIIALFGVFASTYSNVAESHKAIGILKAIGLKNRDVDSIFILEAVILTLSSSVLGGLIGYFLGYYLYLINAIESEWKIPIVAPPTIALLSLLFAVIIAGIGAFIATRAISRKTASELIRVE